MSTAKGESPINQKWILCEAIDQPASDFVLQVLKNRFGTVLHFLPLAAKSHAESTHYVHQLRVSSRRAVAAIQLFRDFLPVQKAKRLLKDLKSIRKSANDARNDDVLLQRLGSKSTEGPKSFDELVSRISSHREKSQKPILCVYRRFGETKLEQSTNTLLDKVYWRENGSEPTFKVFARNKMACLETTFFRLARNATKAPEELHQLRIEGKRLRYTMELLSSAFPETFRSELYPHIAELQEQLGDINDHVTAQLFFQKWIAQLPVGSAAVVLAEMIQKEWKSFQKCQQSFFNEWPLERFTKLQQEWNEVCTVE